MKGIKHESIAAYHAIRADEDRAVCERLRGVIDRVLPEETNPARSARGFLLPDREVRCDARSTATGS
jgi:hypothetical protein